MQTIGEAKAHCRLRWRWQAEDAMRRWARIRGAFRLRRRNVSRIIAAIAAALLAFHTAAAALSPGDESLRRRALGAMGSIAAIENVLPPGESNVAVSDGVFTELGELFILFRPLLAPGPTARCWRKTAPPRFEGGVPRKRRASRTPGWTQKDAAAMIGISTRQLRSYARKPPDQDWPGWRDPVKLKTWLNGREGAARMSRAIKNHLPLREGGVTERGMVGSTVPARRT